MSNLPSRWTTAELDALRDLVGRRLSRSQIGARLHKTRNAVIGMCWRLGLVEDPQVTRAKQRAAALKRNALPPRPDRRVRRVKPAAPVFVAQPGPVGGVGIMQLNGCQCRWPVADDPFRFCAAATDGRSYCPQHHHQATRRPASHETDARDAFVRAV